MFLTLSNERKMALNAFNKSRGWFLLTDKTVPFTSKKREVKKNEL